MTVKVEEWIPLERFWQFHQILCATNGRYLSNPVAREGRVKVNYETQSYEAHCEAWMRTTTEIVELRRDQWWRRALRRAKLAMSRTG